MARRSTLGGNLIPIESCEFVDPKDTTMTLDVPERNSHFLRGSRDRVGLFADPSNGEMNSSLASDEDELNCGEGANGKEEFVWPRVKWTDTMVKLLVTALSYLTEGYNDGSGGGKRKGSLYHKKGKWKGVSKVMAERGFRVSPRQCEDKFNDLNKKYKKLNEALGKGTTCMVVKNPSLLDTMNLSEKAKEEVKKSISSKQLFYEEMCSFHNGNRLFLLHDPDLQRSLHLALGSKEEQDYGNTENVKFQEVSMKRFKQMGPYEDACLGKHFDFLDYNRRPDARNYFTDVMMEDDSLEGSKTDELQNQWFTYRSLQLEEQNLQIKGQMLDLEKQRFKLQKTCWEQDKELENMKLENERLRLENESMALEIESKKVSADQGRVHSECSLLNQIPLNTSSST